MTDLALAWDPNLGEADLFLQGFDLATDDGLRTAVIISLFTDRRARDDDTLPDPGGDRRGWWADSVAPAVVGDELGSRLWLLEREKRSPAVIERVRTYSAEALAWLREDGVGQDVIVTAEAFGHSGIAIRVEIPRALNPGRYDFVWKAA